MRQIQFTTIAILLVLAVGGCARRAPVDIELVALGMLPEDPDYMPAGMVDQVDNGEVDWHELHPLDLPLDWFPEGQSEEPGWFAANLAMPEVNLVLVPEFRARYAILDRYADDLPYANEVAEFILVTFRDEMFRPLLADGEVVYPDGPDQIYRWDEMMAEKLDERFGENIIIRARFQWLTLYHEGNDTAFATWPL